MGHQMQRCVASLLQQKPRIVCWNLTRIALYKKGQTQQTISVFVLKKKKKKEKGELIYVRIIFLTNKYLLSEQENIIW